MPDDLDAEGNLRRRASGAAPGRAEPLVERVWLNGGLVDASEATVSIFDHGLTVGDGVFETLKAIDGRPFATRRHLDRLRRSADGLGLRVPFDDDALRTAMADVLASHDLRLARVRVTVTGGVAPLGSERGEDQATVIVGVGELKDSDPTAAVCVVPWPRNERGAMAGIKTTSYAENVKALAYATERGGTEALFETTTGLLCEGTGSNVFVGIDGRLLTPPLSSGCLAGVTRDLLLEVTDAAEEDIPMAAFREADEVFLTSTGRDVQPVHRVDDRDLPAPGPLTKGAAEAFALLVSSSDDP
jgi:branched-chain amino acid aminotransferase